MGSPWGMRSSSRAEGESASRMMEPKTERPMRDMVAVPPELLADAAAMQGKTVPSFNSRKPSSPLAPKVMMPFENCMPEPETTCGNCSEGSA